VGNVPFELSRPIDEIDLAAARSPVTNGVSVAMNRIPVPDKLHRDSRPGRNTGVLCVSPGKVIRGLVLCSLLALMAGTVAIPSQAPDEITWLDNYRDAVREAKRTQKPIFIEFRCEA
jgi:hypothetical protein